MVTEKDLTDKLYFGVVIPWTADKDCDQGDLEYYRVHVHEIMPQVFLVQAIGHLEKLCWAIRLDQGEVRGIRWIEFYKDDGADDVGDADGESVQPMQLSLEQQEELSRNAHDPMGLVLTLAHIENMEVHLENDPSPCFQV